MSLAARESAPAFEQGRLWGFVRHARISEDQASHFWDRMARAGDTVYGFAVGIYPTDHPALPRWTDRTRTPMLGGVVERFRSDLLAPPGLITRRQPSTGGVEDVFSTGGAGLGPELSEAVGRVVGMPLTHSPQHPMVEVVAGVRAWLKTVADANPTFMSTDDKTVALAELVRASAQLDELRLRILGDAGDLAEATAARDAAGWLAQHTRTRYSDARADLALACALDRDRPLLAAAMREGEATLAQAHVIRRALDALPPSVDQDTVARAEAHLVEQAREFGPKELGRIGRRILDVVAPEIAEAAEAARLADLEAEAEGQTRLVLRRLGDGTTRISGRIPDASAARFATYLEAFANPRLDPRPHDPLARLPRPRRLGRAFVQLLETLDPTRLPVHGGDATTVVVTVPLGSLQADLATAGVLDAGLVPGDELTGDRITADQARRLACTAKILPVVLGGESLPLDLGRARRLFTPAQRKALLLRDRTCRAEGCDIPGTWCEAHHLDPWQSGGPTDLANGLLLCSHHHHRAHDPAHRTDRLPNGDLRFHRRR